MSHLHHFFCFVCQQHFAKSTDLKAHLSTHDRYVCNHCEVDYEEYKDLCCHKLTFCRGANDVKCSFCLKKSKECECAKNFKTTIAQTHQAVKSLSETENGEPSQFFTEIYQYYKDVMLKPSHIKKVDVCQDEGEPSGILDTTWPKLSLENDWTAGVKEFDVFGRNVSIEEIKKECLAKYFTNYFSQKTYNDSYNDLYC